MKTQTVRTRNYRRLYALLQKMSGNILAEELKEQWVSAFSDGRTTSAEKMTSIEFASMLRAMEAYLQGHTPGYAECDRMRKRVIAVIGAWLRNRNKIGSIALIKAIACRAAKTDRFNDIPLYKLRALYSEWKGKGEISVEVDKVIMDIDHELTLMN
jgi:hypothetical protein